MLIGFGTWTVGIVFEFGGMAVIGGTIVIGVGAMFTATGLEYRVGQEQVNTLTNNTTVNDTEIRNTSVEYQYRSVDLPTRLPLGVLVMLLGGVGVLRGINLYT